MALRLRRGLEADRLLITPKAGEIIYVTDTGRLYVGDGTTVGGNSFGDINQDPTPQLGGNLDLNGNDITGTGNINIDGTITATGNINLGDAPADDISVGGSITSNLTPKTDSAFNIGSPSARWNNIYSTGLVVDGHAEFATLTGDIIDNTSTVAFNASTGTFTGTLIGDTQGYHTGDVTGSIFAVDSSPLVDAINGVFRGVEFRSLVYTTEADNPISITTNNQPIFFNSLENDYRTTDADARQIFTRSASAGSVATTDTIGKILWKTRDSSGTILNAFTVDVSTQAMVMLPTLGGSVDLTKYMLIWNNGKVRINGANAGVIANEPDSQLDIAGTMKLDPQTAAPTSPVEGMIAIADRVTWDPAAVGSGPSYPVYYDGTSWNKMT